MWNYEKRLQFPINIKEPNAKLAQVIISQYGGPDGEMGASMRYLSQRYSMPYKEVAGLLTDIGTEELGHLEMVATIVHQLTRNLSMEEIEKSGFANYYVFYPQLGVKLCSMAGGGVQKIYMVLLREPSRRDRSGSDLFHLRDGFEIKMNFDRNVSCFIFVNALMHDDFFD